MYRRKRYIARKKAAQQSSGEGKDKSQIPISIHEVSSAPIIAPLARSVYPAFKIQSSPITGFRLLFLD